MTKLSKNLLSFVDNLLRNGSHPISHEEIEVVLNNKMKNPRSSRVFCRHISGDGKFEFSFDTLNVTEYFGEYYLDRSLHINGNHCLPW